MVNTHKGMIVFLILGLLLGSILDILLFFQNDNIFIFGITVASFLFYGLCYNEKNNLRLVLTSLLTALIVCLPLTRVYNTSYSFLAGFPLMLYIGHCFHYSYHYDSDWRLSYKTLFFAVWNSFIMLVTALIFFGIARMLIMLAAGLFRAVGNNILWNGYFGHIKFFILVNCLLFFIGLGIAHQNYKIIHNLRFLLLRMMQFLLPLLALITIIYFPLYVIALIKPVSIVFMPVEILSGILVLLGIIFFNAYFQTGEERDYFPYWLIILLKIYQLVLFGLAIIVSYRILKSYSISINDSLYLLIALLYTACYAISVFIARDKQRRLIQDSNRALAIFFLAAMLLINNPFYSLSTQTRFDPDIKSTMFQPGPVITPFNNRPAFMTVNQYVKQLDNRLNSLNLKWSANLNQSGFIAGYRNKKSLFICRAEYNNGYQTGSFSDNQCTITYGGKSFPVTNYEVLTMTTDKPSIIWSPYSDKIVPLGFGAESSPAGIRVLYACRVQVNNNFYIGKVVNGHCNIALDDKEIKYPVEWVLVVTKF